MNHNYNRTLCTLFADTISPESETALYIAHVI